MMKKLIKIWKIELTNCTIYIGRYLLLKLKASPNPFGEGEAF